MTEVMTDRSTDSRSIGVVRRSVLGVRFAWTGNEVLFSFLVVVSSLDRRKCLLIVRQWLRLLCRNLPRANHACERPSNRKRMLLLSIRSCVYTCRWFLDKVMVSYSAIV